MTSKKENTTILRSEDGESEIVLERDKGVVGAYFYGKPWDSRSSEAMDMISELVDYLEESSPSYYSSIDGILPRVPMIPLSKGICRWIKEETPWVWNEKVIASFESLQYYETLKLNLKDRALREKSEMVQINLFRRAADCEDIINGLQKYLERV